MTMNFLLVHSASSAYYNLLRKRKYEWKIFLFDVLHYQNCLNSTERSSGVDKNYFLRTCLQNHDIQQKSVLADSEKKNNKIQNKTKSFQKYISFSENSPPFFLTRHVLK